MADEAELATMAEEAARALEAEEKQAQNKQTLIKMKAELRKHPVDPEKVFSDDDTVDEAELDRFSSGLLGMMGDDSTQHGKKTGLHAPFAKAGNRLRAGHRTWDFI